MRLPRAEAAAWRELDDRYVHETGNVEHDLAAVILWADDEGIDTPGIDPLDFRVTRLSVALQSDVARDARGRVIRNRYSKTVQVEEEGGRLVQRTLWAHFEAASDEFRFASLHQRREQVAQDVERLRADVDRTNEHREARGVPRVQMAFNFDAQQPPAVGV